MNKRTWEKKTCLKSKGTFCPPLSTFSKIKGKGSRPPCLRKSSVPDCSVRLYSLKLSTKCGWSYANFPHQVDQVNRDRAGHFACNNHWTSYIEDATIDTEIEDRSRVSPSSFTGQRLFRWLWNDCWYMYNFRLSSSSKSTVFKRSANVSSVVYARSFVLQAAHSNLTLASFSF